MISTFLKTADGLSVQKAIESIIFAHIFTPLPTEIRVEGKGYVLHGSESPRYIVKISSRIMRIIILTTPFFLVPLTVNIERKAWVYGKSLQLKWGEICVRPCEDKWVFVFEVISDTFSTEGNGLSMLEISGNRVESLNK